MTSADLATVLIAACICIWCTSTTLYGAKQSTDCVKAGGAWLNDACRRQP